MNDPVADLDASLAALKRIESELSARDSAAFALESAKLSALQREADVREDDVRQYPERVRAQRHHDVLCLVLKELVQQRGVRGETSMAHIAEAREYADLAYPPPKAEP